MKNKNLEKYELYWLENETELENLEQERKKIIEKIRRGRTMKEKIKEWIKEEGGTIIEGLTIEEIKLNNETKEELE